ncbi:hypothetical protein CMK12_16885 [Candidatus Poribacteria bacterium]|nr:hypothetical protein [Candidatus Poribacteria bacterium]
MINKIKLAFLCFAIFASQAHAEFTDIDWKVAGDSAATYDSTSNLEWLKLTQTDNMSIADVQAELALGSDGQFYGWRLPTENEVETMMTNMFGSLISEGNSNRTWGSNQSSIYSAFANAFHWNYAYAKTGYPAQYDYRSYGLYSTESGETLMSGVRYTNYPKTGQNHKRVYTTYLYEDHASDSYTEDFSNTSYGVFLVSDGGFTINSPALNAVSNVSVPFVSSLSLIGLLGLRRRKSD